MANLKMLHLSGCSSLANLPHAICRLKCLKSLHLDHCVNLRVLPADIFELTSLLTLSLERNLHCHNLQHLPDLVSKLENLQNLVLTCCHVRIWRNSLLFLSRSRFWIWNSVFGCRIYQHAWRHWQGSRNYVLANAETSDLYPMFWINLRGWWNW